MVDDSIAGPHDLRKAEESDSSHHQTRQSRLEEVSPARQVSEARAQIAESFRKYQGNNTASEPQDCISGQLSWITQDNLGNSEDGLGAPEPACDHNAGDRKQHHRAQHRRTP